MPEQKVFSFRLFYILTLAVTLIAGLVFTAFNYQWLRDYNKDELLAFEEGLMRIKRDHLSILVDMVFQDIEGERQSVRDRLGIAADDEEGLREADEYAKERIKERLRHIRLDNEGYFWINEILNYEGGDNYARRVVHPNLPETEGMYLSTNVRDSDGRLPYLMELEGVKKDGFLFFQYQFKKPGVDEVGMKLSYARLYKDFDWVVATGIYLDDIDELLSKERAVMDNLRTGQLITNVVFSFLIFGAAMACVVLLARWKYKEISTLAERDQLTQLYNRRIGQDRLIQECSRGARGNSLFCILLCDLDHFKKINDTYGHNAGDEVLRRVSQVFKETLRVSDSAFRWGGEEFLFVLGDVDIHGGLEIAERLRASIESLQVFWEGREIQVTITIGLASYKTGEDPHMIVSRADIALYQGKASGRNKVVSAA